MTSAVLDGPAPSAVSAERFERIDLTALYESPMNPRKTFDATEDARLEASVREKGIIEPLVVRQQVVNKFEIICGARRYRAAKRAGLVEVPAIVREYSNAQAMEIMAVENGQRAHVPPLEEALGYKKLLLIDTTYTAAMIATKIGHDERYVWNRLRLLEAIPEVQQLLRAGLIGVEHAELLSKLKPADQKRAIGKESGGLFTADYALAFDDRTRAGSTGHDRLKAVSVRELRQWIATHVRLDLVHAAQAAPLDFGETAARVVLARSDDIRGKTPIPITFRQVCPDHAKSDDERTYGATAWKKAEGKDGQPTCDYARLGFVVAGERYGESFLVCINREKCLVHWKDSVKAKEKATALRSKGETKKAAKVEKKAAAKHEQQWEREQREEKAREAAWTSIEKFIVSDALDQVKGVKALTPSHAKAIEAFGGELGFDDIKKHLGASWFKTPAAAFLVSMVTYFSYSAWREKRSGFEMFVHAIAKPLGLDIKRLEAVRDAHQPKAETPAPKKKAKAS